MSELKSVVYDCKADIICITESHLDDLISDEEISIPNYNISRVNRNRSGGGSVIFTHVKLKSTPLDNFKVPDCVGVKIETSVGLLNVVCIYRSPALSEDDNKLLLSNLNNLQVDDDSELIIVGDLNLPDVNWESGVVVAPYGTRDKSLINQQEFLDVIVQKGLVWHITNQVTRRKLVNGELQESTLDQILTSNENLVENITISAPLGRSDHVIIKADLRILDNATYVPQEKRSWNKCNTGLVRIMGENTDWSFSCPESDIEGMWEDLNSKVMSIVDNCVPLTVQKCTAEGVCIKKVPWECSRLRRFRRKKDTAWRVFDCSPTHINLKIAMDTQQLFESSEYDCKKTYEVRIAKAIKYNPRMFYSYVRAKRKVNKSVGSLHNPTTGKRTESPLESAQVLVEYFASVFKDEPLGPLTKCCYDPLPGITQIGELEINDSDVQQLLIGLDIHKSPGPDGIHPKILKVLGENSQFVSSVANLFRACAVKQVTPKAWKRALITALHKKGSIMHSCNYRPISLLSILSKLYEKLLRRHILNHIIGLISPDQHGFTEGRSCLSNLLESIDELTELLETEEQSDVIYLDFQKAFDSVPHGRLLVKLESLGISGSTLKIINEILSDRWMAVRVGSHISSWERVKSGVPQGSVLGPLLFSVFINDLPDAVNSSTKMFADDVKLIGNAKKPEIIQNDLDNLTQWAETWAMTFNAEKCHAMHMGVTNAIHKYVLCGKELASVDKECDLGVIMSNQGNWIKQIDEVIGKATRTTAWIFRNITSRSLEVLLPLYKTLVRPHLEYCVQVWAPTPRVGNWSYIMALENCQRKFTKRIEGFGQLSYEERLSKLGLTTLLERRARGDLIETFKIVSGLVNYGQDMFSKSRSGRNLLHMPYKATTKGNDIFKRRVIKYWNCLPICVKEANNTDDFKAKLEHHKMESISKGIHNGYWELSQEIFRRL